MTLTPNNGCPLDDFDNPCCLQDTFDEGNSAALSYISYIGGSLSILACVVVVVVFEYFRLWLFDNTLSRPFADMHI